MQPKDLYRKLAALLAEIDKGNSEANYLLSVLMKLENSFIRDLHITRGRLYVEDQEQFLPANGLRDNKPADPVESLALTSEASRLVVKNGVYIFNDRSLAAFSVRDPSRQWIFEFELEAGWIWEEVEFCLNAVRAQLNFQLHIDSMNSDVQQAVIIQRSLLPDSPPFIDGYELAGRCQPADAMGGDFFDFSILDEQFFNVAIGDASGHGLPAALLVRDVVTGLRLGVEREMRMAVAMQKLNRVIHRSTLSSNFVSLFFAEIENTGHVLYVNAGHPPPLLVHGSEVKRLEPTGMILGAVADTYFRRASANFEPGTVLVIYSDGVLERRRDDEQFGISRLEEMVMGHQEESATAILGGILEAVTAFGGGSKFEDDLTLVVIKKVSQ
jgi:sigma-B regulation protein RsbU (phosphoserine phosphatase)